MVEQEPSTRSLEQGQLDARTPPSAVAISRLVIGLDASRRGILEEEEEANEQTWALQSRNERPSDPLP